MEEKIKTNWAKRNERIRSEYESLRITF